jgi:alpha-glucoside transport system substrate-binding protein
MEPRMRQQTRFLRVRAVLALCAALVAVGGCDGSAGTDGDLKGTTVEVTAVWTGDEQRAFQRVLDAFARETGAHVVYTSAGNDIATVLGTRIQGGKPPDVALLPQPGLLSDLAGQHALVPVDAAVAKEAGANYDSIWRQQGSVDGTLYGIWFDASNKSLMWYRPKAFQSVGVSTPTSWPQLVQASRALSDAGITPLSVGAGDGWVLTDWFENVYLRTAGPLRYDQLTRHQLPWTDGSVITALQLLSELWGVPGGVVGGTKGSLQYNMPQSVVNTFGDRPRGAMVFEGNFVATTIRTETGSRLGDTAKEFDFPSIDSSPPSVVGGGDVAVAMTRSRGAMELMHYLASPEAAQVLVGQGGFISPNKRLDFAAYPDATLRQVAQSLIRAGATSQFRFDMSDQEPPKFGGTPAQGEWKILQDFIADPSDVTGTARRLEAAARQDYGS